MSTIIKEPPLEGTPVTGPAHGSSPARAAAAASAVKDTGREYVVLQQVADEENRWAELGSFPAATSEQAIRDAAAVQAADPDIDTTGVLTYVAVPARSFQSVELTARVEPKIEFRSKP